MSKILCVLVVLVTTIVSLASAQPSGFVLPVSFQQLPANNQPTPASALANLGTGPAGYYSSASAQLAAIGQPQLYFGNSFQLYIQAPQNSSGLMTGTSFSFGWSTFAQTGGWNPIFNATNNGTTVYTFTFSLRSYPEGVLTFTPATFTFQLFTNASLPFNEPAVINAYWLPNQPNITVNVTAVSTYALSRANETAFVSGDLYANLIASNVLGLWPTWNWNLTSAPGAVTYSPYGVVAINATMDCTSAQGVQSCPNNGAITNRSLSNAYWDPSSKDLEIVVTTRPLLLYTSDFEVGNTQGTAWDSNYARSLTGNSVADRVVTFEYTSYTPSPWFIVSLPLSDSTGSIGSNLGVATDERVQYFTPGRNNAGGSLTISLAQIWSTDTNNNIAPVTGTRPFDMFPTSVTIDANNPSAAFAIQPTISYALGNGGLAQNFKLVFRVVENTTAPSVSDDLSNTKVYPNGAYSIPLLQLNRKMIQTTLYNLGVLGGVGTHMAVPQPIHPSIFGDGGSYHYQLRIDYSPSDLGMGSGSISYPFSITPAGSVMVLIDGRNVTNATGFGQFTFSGSQRIIDFVLETQGMASGESRVNWTFTAPILPAGYAVEDFPLNGVTNGSYSTALYPISFIFDIVENVITTQITNNLGGTGTTLSQRVGLWAYEPFWVQFQWDPPTTADLSFTLTGGAGTIQFGDTAGTYSMTYTVPVGSTGFLAGPIMLLPPTSNLAPTNNPVGGVSSDFDVGRAVMFTVSLSGSNAPTYKLDSNVQNVVLYPDRVSLLSVPTARRIQMQNAGAVVASLSGLMTVGNRDTIWYELSSLGYASEPFCVGLALGSAMFDQLANQEIWVTPWAKSVDIHNTPELKDRSGLIFTPLDNPASAAPMPAASVVLSRNKTRGCFSVSFDRNWPFMSSQLINGFTALNTASTQFSASFNSLLLGSIGVWQVQATIAGPGAQLVFEKSSGPGPAGAGVQQILFVPDYFIVRRPLVSWKFLGSQTRDQGDTQIDGTQFVAGQTVDVQVSVSVPPKFGLNYTLAAGYLTPGTQSGYFAPGEVGPKTHSVQLNVNNTAVLNFPTGGTVGAISSTVQLWTFGSDAVFYQANPAPNANAATVNDVLAKQLTWARRTLITDLVSTDLVVGYKSWFTITLNDAVQQGLGIMPVVGDYRSSTSLVVDPPGPWTFRPGGATSLRFSVLSTEVTMHQLFTLSLRFVTNDPTLPDWQWFEFDGASSVTIASNMRPAPVINSGVHEQSGGVRILAGVTYGPLKITLAVPLQPNEGTITLTPTANGLTFTPSSITFNPGEMEHEYSVRWDPPADDSIDEINVDLPASPYIVARTLWAITATGNARFYYPMQTLPQDMPVSFRNITAQVTGVNSAGANTGLAGAYPGVVYEGQIVLQMPPPAPLDVALLGAGLQFNPPVVSFSTSDVVKSFQYNVVASIPISDLGMIPDGTLGTPNIANDTLKIYAVPTSILNPSNLGSLYYNSMAAILTPAAVITVIKRSFVIDLQNVGGIDVNTQVNSQPQIKGGNLPSAAQRFTYMLGKQSDVHTISLSTAPLTGPLQVTFSSPYLQFTPSSLTFEIGSLTGSFTITPIAVPPALYRCDVDVLVAGNDAHMFDVSPLRSWFNGNAKILVVPEIDISPIEPIYTDGDGSEVIVTMKYNGTLSGTVLPTTTVDAFTVKIEPYHYTVNPTQRQQNVIVQPSFALEFSAHALATDNQVIRKFWLKHVSPSQFNIQTSYQIKYSIVLGSGAEADISELVPIHARTVILKRYNIIPQFPNVLGFDWQPASFNLTRMNHAHFSLTPHTPNTDGNSIGAYGGDYSAGGRVVFDPPVIVFEPYQMVQNFWVKAIAGNNQESVYYRVEWDMDGHPDDLVNYIEAVSPRNSNVDDPWAASSFATWHTAGSALTGLSAALAVLAVLCALLWL